MEQLEALLNLNTTYILIGLFVVFFTLEQVLSTQFRFARCTQHFGNNVLFMVLLFIINIFWAAINIIPTPTMPIFLLCGIGYSAPLNTDRPTRLTLDWMSLMHRRNNRSGI